MTLFGILDKCYDMYQCSNCTLIFKLLYYHAFDAFAMLHCQVIVMQIISSLLLLLLLREEREPGFIIDL